MERMLKHLLLFTGAWASAACAARGPAFRDPVGQSMVGATRTERATGAAPETASASPSSVDAYVEGTGAGPCGATPPVVAFPPSSMELAEPQSVQLGRLAECLTSAPYDTASVVLVGYTDVMGTVPANLELGLARAQVVMRELMRGGVAPGRIVVASAGELQRPQAHWGLQAHRVEVLIARGGPARPNEAPVVRGIDAEGLMPRPPSTKPPASPPAAIPAAPPRTTSRPAPTKAR